MKLEELEIDIKYKERMTVLNFNDESFIEITQSKIKFFTTFNGANLFILNNEKFKKLTWEIYKGNDFIVFKFSENGIHEEIIFNNYSIKHKIANNMMSHNDNYILLFSFIFDFISEEMIRLGNNKFID